MINVTSYLHVFLLRIGFFMVKLISDTETAIQDNTGSLVSNPILNKPKTSAPSVISSQFW